MCELPSFLGCINVCTICPIQRINFSIWGLCLVLLPDFSLCFYKIACVVFHSFAIPTVHTACVRFSVNSLVLVKLC